MTSKRTSIATALKNLIDGISSITTVSFDQIKLLASDFQEFELPAVQIVDMAEDSVHEQGRALKTWNLSLEIVIGPKPNYIPTQPDLWDLLETLETEIFKEPKLGLSYVTQITLLGSTTDLHILQPLYTARMDLQIGYYQLLRSSC